MKHSLIPMLLALICAPTLADIQDDWAAYRDSLLQDPELVRYHDFQQATTEAVPELTDAGADLAYSPVGQAAQPLELIEGRWPGKRAVRLDQGFLHAPPFDVPDRSFTIEAWLRTNGMGGIAGSPITTGGTLLSAGIGFWDGWRVTMKWPEQVVGFEVGRPKPQSSFGIGTGRVADGAWQHLVASWDGEHTRVFVDGLLAAEGEYAGDYTPPTAGGQFRIGFAGNGWGSAKLDVDEVAAYSRALSEAEVLQHALFHASPSDAVAAQLVQANAALRAGEHAAAARGFEAVANAQGAHPDVTSMARLGLAQVRLAERKLGEALRLLTSLLEDENLSDGLRARALVPLHRLALDTADAPSSLYETLLEHADALPSQEVVRLRLNLARSYAKAGNAEAAQAQFTEVMAMDELTSREKAEALLKAGHAAAQTGACEEARKRYAAVGDIADLPPQYESLAQLCTARTYIQEKDWTNTLAAYEAVAGIEGAPGSHIWEAQECLREVERLQAGKLARDPAATRTVLPKRPQPGMELFVGPDGDDANPGTRQEPFATLQAARDAIVVLGALPRGGATVTVLPGTYQATETLKLEARNSGSEAAPIVYRAARPGTVRFTGGAPVTAFETVTDTAILDRLPEEARGKVMEAELGAQGLTEFGELMPRGMGRPQAPVLEVFFDGKPLTPARWPNEGFVHTGKIIDSGSNNPARDTVFEYEGDRPSRWTEAADVWLFGFWRHLWADDTLKVTGIDTETHQLTTAPTSYGEIAANMPYHAFNLLEEIDQPGEWYLDRKAGILYMYPPSDPNAADVQLSMLPEAFVEMDGVSWVTLEGLTFDLGRGNGIVIREGESCLIAGCTVSRIGGTGVTIDGGRNHGVLSSDLHTLGRNGTWVKGGDRQTLTPGGHFIENCHIYDFSRVCRTYTPAFWTDGVGNRFAHNLVHGSPGHGMRIEGNEHVIEFNEVYDVVRETDDQGGIDMWGNPTYRGVVLRYNFWHDIGNDRACGQCGIRLDDAICEVLIYGNVFYRCSTAQFGGVQIHGGKENYIENNLFADCKYAVSFSGWGPERWHQVLNNPGVVKSGRDSVDITRPPHSTRYPALARLEEDEGVNRVWRNLVYNCGGFLTRDRGIQDVMDNEITSEDPGFIDAENLDFTLKTDSPLTLGGSFRPIPFGEIGLYEDDLRPTVDR